MTAKQRPLLVAEEWAGYLSLRCAQCRFAALQDGQMSKHLVGVHQVDADKAQAAMTALRAANPQLRSGQPVIEPDDEEPEEVEEAE